MQYRYPIVTLLALALITCTCTAQQQPQLDVPYVPTPEPVVRKMLEMAEVKEGDVVYDLGCGDGRIVIAAVKDFGAARGVGVDLDPERIRESNENAKAAGITDRVKFVEQDLFTMDFSEADVIAMYLLSSVNLKLRPQILELRPGTRIVSHAFDMDEWEPDAHATVEESGGQNIYFWIVPAKVEGTWSWQADTPQGREEVALNLQQDFQKISGTAKVGQREYKIEDAKLKGDQLSFTLRPPGQPEQATALRYRGRVEGDTITGRVFTDGADQAQPAGARLNDDQRDGAPATDRPNGEALGAEWTAHREGGPPAPADANDPAPQQTVPQRD